MKVEEEICGKFSTRREDDDEDGDDYAYDDDDVDDDDQVDDDEDDIYIWVYSQTATRIKWEIMEKVGQKHGRKLI